MRLKSLLGLVWVVELGSRLRLRPLSRAFWAEGAVLPTTTINSVQRDCWLVSLEELWELGLNLRRLKTKYSLQRGLLRASSPQSLCEVVQC